MAKLNTNALLKPVKVWDAGSTQDFPLTLENGLYIFNVGKEIDNTLRATAVQIYIFGNDGGGVAPIIESTSQGKYFKFYAVAYVQDGVKYKGARYEKYTSTTLTAFGNANVYSIYKVL